MSTYPFQSIPYFLMNPDKVVQMEHLKNVISDLQKTYDLAASGRQAALSIITPTTKGQLITHDGTSPVLEPLGTDDYIYSASSGSPTGHIWITKAAVVSGGGGVQYPIPVDNATITGGTNSGDPLVATFTPPSDASNTVKGITKLSVAAVSPTNPIAVGDNDPRNTNARTPTAHAATHTNGTDDIQNATTGQKGLLTSTDWNIFANKLGVATVTTQTADFTLALSDAWSIIKINAAANINVTIPLNATIAFPIGTMIWLWQNSTGKPAVIVTGGVTLNLPDGLNSTRVQYSTIRLEKVATDEWVLAEDIGNAYDADALAFFTADGTLSTSIKNAVNTWFVSAKANGYYSKYSAVYLFVGGTASSHKWNAINPVDSDAAFRMTFTGSPTHNANGVTWNGSSQYGNTKLTPSVTLAQNNKGYSISLKTIGTGIQFGSINGSFQGEELWVIESGANTYFHLSSTLEVSATPGSSAAFFNQERETSVLAYLFRNNSLHDTQTAATTVNPAYEVYVGCRNQAGSPVGYSADNVCFFAIKNTYFTTGERASEYADVGTLQTALGR